MITLLLPIMTKLFEKLILKRLKPIINEKNLVPTHQFGLRNNLSTIDQVHCITDVIEKTLESKLESLLYSLWLRKSLIEYGIMDIN
jgi:hypothetical protein